MSIRLVQCVASGVGASTRDASSFTGADRVARRAGARMGIGVRVALCSALLLLASPATASLPFFFSPEFADLFVPPDPSLPGPFAVGHSQFEAVDPARGGRTLPVDVWYPVDPIDAIGSATFYELMNFAGTSLGLFSTLAIEDAPVTHLRFRSLIVFSHGSGSIRIQSAALMEALASHGFVVVSPDHVGNTTFTGPDEVYEDVLTDRPKDLSFLIDEVMARAFDPTDPLFLAVRPFGVGVTGHSLGGYTALAMAAGYADSASGPVAPDPRVRAILPVSGVAGVFSDEELRGIEIPIMLLGGSNDTVVPIDPNSIRPFELASSLYAYRVDIEGPTHSHFANICDIAEVILGLGIGVELWPAIGAGALVDPYLETCVPPAYPLSEAIRIQNLYSVAFFKRHLALDLRYNRYLKPEYAEANEPDVFLLRRGPRCGLGFELVGVLPVLIALRRRSLRSGDGGNGEK